MLQQTIKFGCVFDFFDISINFSNTFRYRKTILKITKIFKKLSYLISKEIYTKI